MWLKMEAASSALTTIVTQCMASPAPWISWRTESTAVAAQTAVAAANTALDMKCVMTRDSGLRTKSLKAALAACVAFIYIHYIYIYIYIYIVYWNCVAFRRDSGVTLNPKPQTQCRCAVEVE